MKGKGVLLTFLCLALLGQALCAGSALALAAPSAGATATLPSARLPKTPPTFDVQLWPEASTVSLVVNATVATGTPLPVKVRLPVPAGASVDWVGEILGGRPEDDVPVAYRFADGGKVLELVLTTARIAQYEAAFSPPQQESGLLVSRLEWVQTVPASSVDFAVRAAADLKDVTVTPTSRYAPQFNAQGERLWVLESRKMAVGDKASVRVSYRVGTTASAASQEGGATLSTLVGWLLAGIAAAVAALVWALRRQSRAVPRG